jgi:hypothetical protein
MGKHSRSPGKSSWLYALLDCHVGLWPPRNDGWNVYLRHCDIYKAAAILNAALMLCLCGAFQVKNLMRFGLSGHLSE